MKINVYQLAERYEVAVSTVYNWLNRGWMPKPRRLGGRVYWLTADLDLWDSQGNPRCDSEEKEFQNER